MSQSLKSHKGCAMCKPNKWKMAPEVSKTPYRYLRQMGKKRRVSTKDDIREY